MEPNDTTNNLAAFILALDLQYSAEFVPFSKSRNAGNKDKSLNWKVTIKRGRQSVTTDYTQGVGHIRGYKLSSPFRITLDEEEALLRAVEGGFIYAVRNRRPEKQPTPSLQDVLHSLVQDAEVLDHGSYEDWAANYGYDEDSRKGEQAYRACLALGLKTRSMLGDHNLATLRALFQDY